MRRAITILLLSVAVLSACSARQDVEQPTASESGMLLALNEEHVSVQIQPDGVVPPRLEVSPGTTIAWINKTTTPVRVQFTGKAVSTTCMAPRGFEVGSAGVYESTELASEEVASLCFLEPELYVYEILYLGSDLSDAGGYGVDRPRIVGSVLVSR